MLRSGCSSVRCRWQWVLVAALTGNVIAAVPPVPQPGAQRSPAAAVSRAQAMSGSWVSERLVVGITRPGVVPLQPEYNARLEKLVPLAVAGKEVPGNEPRCIPNGPIMGMNFGMRVMADAEQMAVITNGPRVRFIWLDGRNHTPDELLFESFEGESVAHWDGEVLVVDTVGLKPSNEIVFGVPLDDAQTHMLERWKLLSPTRLQIDTTIENPKVLTKPWSYTRRYVRQALSDELTYCVPALDRAREGGLDLTPPSGGYIPPGVE